jgi:hypothetical protein
MEPTNVNPDNRSDPALEAWLQANARSVPLPDHGFSDRVLRSLPAPVPRRASRDRWLFCAGGAVAGLAVAGIAFVGDNGPGQDIASALRPLGDGLEAFSSGGVGLAAGIALASLAYAFRSRTPTLPRWFIAAVLPFARPR